jgi:potassium efflux system protein
LVAFGETSLEFELRCVVAEVEKGLSVRSELHYAIIQKFREAGIGRFGPKPGDT